MGDSKNLISQLFAADDGAAAVEYALMVSGIALAVLTGVVALGGTVLGLFDAFNKLFS